MLRNKVIYLVLLFLLPFQVLGQDSTSSRQLTNAGRLQSVIDKNEYYIEKYYKHLQLNKGALYNLDEKYSFSKKQLDSVGKLFSLLSDSVTMALEDISNKKHSKYLYADYLRINELLLNQKKIAAVVLKANESLNLHRYTTALRNTYNNSRKKIIAETESLVGVVRFSYNNESYFGYVVDPKQELVLGHVNIIGRRFQPNSLDMARAYLEELGSPPLMITNGGMFTTSFSPEGLFINEQKELARIDTSGPKNVTLNFYLMPNGVFYSEKGKYHIQTTKAFNSLYKSQKISPRFATQSGPMLVVNSKHHPSFNYGSTNRKLRSGVGIMANGNVVFLISENHRTNFFQFATIFKDVFNCPNALFLDGEISQMQFSKRLPRSGRFGPILAVIKKKN